MELRKRFSIVLISIVLGVLNCSAKNIVVFGTVTDADGEPLIGVSVVDKQSHKGVTTDLYGKYRIEIPTEAGVIITFSYVGMESVDLKVAVASDEKIQHDVVLTNSANVLSEVVVTGMFTRPTDTFTGSSTVYSVERLAASGNQNILSSLQSVDPSFAIDNNLATGSNPNTMPNLQIRGATSINIKGDYEGNSNQPLLILDGFETPLEKLFDMDMERVSSVTILKDASAKAIYGSKAGNGVIVVETQRPSLGSPTVHYTGTLNIDSPDISSYNLMDASTKLDFEVARGMYDRAATYEQLQQQHDLLKVYRDNIARGVDTDWLSLATHTGIGTKHTVAVEGGSERWRYQGGAMYNGISGVMKGSDRNILNINGLVLYDNSNLRIRNAIDFTNTIANNSPLGQFSEFLNLNPYLVPYTDEGTPLRIIAYGENGFPVYNPLYNAAINTLYKDTYWELRNNFSVDWQLHRLCKLTANFSYTYRRASSDNFLPEGNTELEKPDSEGRYFLNGRYDMTKSISHTYAGSLGLNYNQSIGKHAWFVNTNVNIQSSHLRRHNYTTIDSDLGNSKLLTLSDASPWLTERYYDGADDRRREIGFIAAASYAFDNRYLLDTSVRESGSSVFGSDNRWGCFWSVGIGWNLHNERFLSSLGWLKQLKLRASTGYTGNQTFDPYQSRSRYIHLDYLYGGEFGALLSCLPNNSLRWQKIHDTDIGIDLCIAQWLNLKFDYYWQATNDMLNDITIAPSTGFSSYKANIGQIDNRGYELTVALTPWRNKSVDGWFSLSVSGMHNDNKVTHISNLFDTFNKAQNKAKTQPLSITDRDVTRHDYELDRLVKTTPSTLYYEGCSTTAIWGVPSLGIDPMTGRRIYLDRNGNITYNWDVADQVIIGDRAPKLSGNILLSGGWKGFSFALSMSYSLGGDIYNTTLVNKVENVTGYDNLDMRILDSWQNVGDVSPYRALSITTSDKMDYTKPNSSFVQRNNELICNSLNVSYDFDRIKSISRLGFQRLKLALYLNDLFRLSTVQVERGTSYPYARNYSISIQATY